MAQPQEKSTAFKSCWERLHLLHKCGSKDPAQSADVFRLLMLQMQWARAEKLLDAQAASELFMKHAENYSQVVDSPDPNEGVNNYAEGALTLLEGKPNESKMWTSSLKEKISSMACVKDALKLSWATNAMLHPEDKLDVPMKLTKPAPKPSGKPSLTSVDGNSACSSSVKFNFRQTTTGSASDNGPNFNLANSVQHANTSNRIAPNQFSEFNAPNSPPMDGFNRNTKGQSSMNRKPGLLNDPSRKDAPRNPWNCDNSNSGPWNSNTGAWNSTTGPGQNRRNERNDNGGQFRRGKGQGSFNGSADYDGQPKGYNGSNQPSRNSAADSRDCGASNQRKGLFSSVRQNNENNYGRGAQGPPDFNNGDEEENNAPGCGFFKSAREQLAIDNQKKFGRDKGGSLSSSSYGTAKKSLGTRRGPNTKFVPPVMSREDEDDGGTLVRKAGPCGKSSSSAEEGEEIVDERLKNIEPKMIELITNEIMDHGPPVNWDDIAGLEFAKNTIKEIVVWPMLRPDIFTGLRGPPKGLLLFGPPGTGKTLIGKCIASQSKSTFFSISASSLTSKWVGEGEKMVRALFAVARVHQPSVIFLDEIDSLLSQRSDGEHEASRRIKTEFLVQLDGATTSSEERILCVGATNRPQEIDEAARRRFVKRLYIPLPESPARRQIVVNLLQDQGNTLNEGDLETICQNTDGYSGADMANLCREAALGPIRSINFADIENITADQVRPITAADFQNAIKNVRPSVSSKDLIVYLDWNKQYGTWDI